jgi:predicted nucleic acid-binding protein
MIFVDTNILGTFAIVEALDVLLGLFADEECALVPAVYAEVAAGVREGRQFLQSVLDLVDAGRLKVVPLTADEIVGRQELPTSLDDGEAESITICQTRSAAFVTNDKRARNYCRTVEVEVFDLVEVLRSLWKLAVCSKRDVRRLGAQIEAREGMVFKNKEQIFAK